MSKTYDVDDIMDLGPCSDYPRCRVAELWAGSSGLTAREIGMLDIPETARAWALIKLISDQRALRSWACDTAEAICRREQGPQKALERIAVARQFIAGAGSRRELGTACSEARSALMASPRSTALVWGLVVGATDDNPWRGAQTVAGRATLDTDERTSEAVIESLVALHEGTSRGDAA